ncbi:MAG: glutaredoxin family protein [Archangium sp.]|nr:glutaredoxin family protein [Archangium sp.]
MIVTPTEIHVYGKPGCSSCDEALELLDDTSARFTFTVVRHNILGDEALFEKYRYLVPVVVIGGIERLRSRFDPQELEAALLASKVPRRE